MELLQPEQLEPRQLAVLGDLRRPLNDDWMCTKIPDLMKCGWTHTGLENWVMPPVDGDGSGDSNDDLTNMGAYQ